MKKFVFLFLGFFSVVFAQELILSSVIKIYKTGEVYNYSTPWAAPRHVDSSGSGCIIENNRILTNAHVVDGAVYLELKKANNPRRYAAKVEHINHAFDLAIITPLEDEFFENTTALRLGELPLVQDTVLACGYPAGGNELAITKGQVSRIEYMEYVHSQAYLLACQIDAPTNPGNSGGPILSLDGSILGIAMQSNPDLQNTGHMVPVTLIKNFLITIDQQKQNTLIEPGIHYQKMIHSDLKQAFGLLHYNTGILITRIELMSCFFPYLQPRDILLEIDHVPILDDGSIQFRKTEFLPFLHLIKEKRIHDSIHLKILRSGQVEDLLVPLTHDLFNQELIPSNKPTTPPSYFVYAGLVFQPLDLNYIQTGLMRELKQLSKLLKYVDKYQSDKKKQVVLLSKVLSHTSTKGYHDIRHEEVTKINGYAIDELKDVPKAFENNPHFFHIIETKSGLQCILNAQESLQAHFDILKQYHIHQDRSDDLLD
ncbi:MAG: Serine protease Do-like HtrA [Chlamydiae bacterium]|nr:Serine protease Do-like HtrA [Chlamydiota bacterium]